MKTIAIKILPFFFALLSAACVHYPGRYGYYSSGYTNYYGASPRRYSPYPQHYNQYDHGRHWGGYRRYSDSDSGGRHGYFSHRNRY